MPKQDDRFEVIEDVTEGGHHMRYYKLDKPRRFENGYGDVVVADGLYASYVAATMDTKAPETMVFPYDTSKNEIISWSELFCSSVDSVTDDSAVRALLDIAECV